MNEPAVTITENLNLDVSCAPHELLQIDLVVAKGCFGLSPRNGHELRQLRIIFDDPHAATATTPARFQHDWVANAPSKPPALLDVSWQWRGRRHDRHASGGCKVASCNLVTERAHRVRPWADEDQSGSRAAFCKLWIFRQKPIPRMDG